MFIHPAQRSKVILFCLCLYPSGPHLETLPPSPLRYSATEHPFFIIIKKSHSWVVWRSRWWDFGFGLMMMMMMMMGHVDLYVLMYDDVPVSERGAEEGGQREGRS